MPSPASKSDWVFCLALDAPGLIFAHDPYCFGHSELTRHPDPMPGCEAALTESAGAFAVALREEQLRLRMFFLDCSAENAERYGRLHARETLDLFSLAHPLTGPRLLEAGYLFDLKGEAAQPLLPSPQRATSKMMGTVALFDARATRPGVVLASLLAVSPETYGELGSAVRRSTHWARLAREAVDRGEKLMMFWMAGETLARVEEDEILTPKFVAASGFPYSRYLLSMTVEEQSALGAIQDHELWKRRLKKLFEKLREARNAVAHSGFRELDMGAFFDEREMQILERVMPLMVIRLQHMAVEGLAIGVRSIAGLWDQFGACASGRAGEPSFSTWVGGTVLHFLNEK